MNTTLQTAEHWEQWLATAIAKETELPLSAIDTTAPIASFALDSIVTVTLAADIEKELGKEIDPTVFWEFPDIKSLAAWIAAQ